MKVLIEGDLEQVCSTLAVPEAPKSPRQINRAANDARRETLINKRQRIRLAFDKVRYNPEDKALAQQMLDALTKVRGVTDAALKLAEKIIETRS